MTPGNATLLTPSQAERRYVVLSGLQWLPIGLVVPVLVLMLRARGLELPVIGALFAVYTVVVIVLELPTGSFADVLGRRRTLVISRVLSVVSLAGMAVATDVVQFGVVMALAGIILVISMPSINRYLHNARLRDSTSRVMGDIRLARQKAVTNNSRMWFWGTNDVSYYWIGEQKWLGGELYASTSWRMINLPSTVRMRNPLFNTTNYFWYAPDGQPYIGTPPFHTRASGGFRLASTMAAADTVSINVDLSGAVWK